jgi:hypothetical protein
MRDRIARATPQQQRFRARDFPRKNRRNAEVPMD